MDIIEEKICRLIDEHQEEIIAFGKDIWHHAELGFQEHRTAAKFAEKMKEFGLFTQEGLALTGVKSYLKGKNYKGTTVALMGEFDGLPIPDNADANPETGAAHCCGHDAQCTGVMGAAFALTDPEVKAAMDGNIVFFGVPAEEYVQVELRNEMRKKGLVRYGCGKCELLRIGALDDVDITVGHHAGSEKKYCIANRSCNGFVTKTVHFKGKAAHGTNPQDAINAMAAANLAMVAVDAQRETFRDEDCVRVHGCVTKVTGASNIISDEVTMEYSVRGKILPAYVDASKKVDRAMRAGSIATGCGVTITTVPGNMPIRPVKDTRAVEEALDIIANGTGLPVTCTGPDFHSKSSGDYGDISAVMPLLQFNTGGYRGEFHSPSAMLDDPYEAYVVPAKLFALIGYKLLKNGGDYACALMDSFEQLMTREQYVAFMESMMTEEVVPPAPCLLSYKRSFLLTAIP